MHQDNPVIGYVPKCQVLKNGLKPTGNALIILCDIIESRKGLAEED